MEISHVDQHQKAGDNSEQIQIANQTINYNGVPATDVVSIATSVCGQMLEVSKKYFSDIATATVYERIGNFEKVLALL